ncbi:MAG TPA: phosphonopyruvate decarboxylase [Verrucomicrobiae bacterium]|nr:phosphonopyruvate decarboxylase [Verrucomicrobiae bacterium]
MIPALDFVSLLKKNKIRFFTGVPCSFFQSAINCVIADKQLRYTMVPNEGAALAAAAGAYLAGEMPAVMIQNSGFGNLVNPLTSLHMIYKIPALLFISGRAYGVSDEPQHEIVGKTLPSVLDALGVRHQDLPDAAADFDKALGEAVTWMEKEKKPFVFLVRKGCVGSEDAAAVPSSPYPLKRVDAIKIISEFLTGDEFVIATTGMPSRELFSISDRAKNFYMQGSMGHAPSIALGLALANPQKKVIVLDGDGALLMHLGSLSSIGHYAPKRFCHLVLDNEAYETTGNQDTTSRTTDFAKIALACGYARAADAVDEKQLRAALKSVLAAEGPSLVRIKINREPAAGIPRITTKYNSEQIAAHFKEEVLKS